MNTKEALYQEIVKAQNELIKLYSNNYGFDLGKALQKKIALLTEQINSDIPILDKLLSEITPEEEARVEKEMSGQIEQSEQPEERGKRPTAKEFLIKRLKMTPIQANTIYDEYINLCSTCKNEIPTCKGNPKFGNGIGNDNVIQCVEYLKKSQQPEVTDSDIFLESRNECLRHFNYNDVASVMENGRVINEHGEGFTAGAKWMRNRLSKG